MTPEAIHSFLEKEKGTPVIKVEFKKRNVMRGMFVNTGDYHDLSVKNLWRIVPEANIEQWNKKQDNNLQRIFSGSEFTKLTSTNAPLSRKEKEKAEQQA